MGKGRGRPGGNPDFGKKYKFDNGNPEPRTEVLAIRFTPTEMAALKELGGENYREYYRQLILSKITSA